MASETGLKLVTQHNCIVLLILLVFSLIITGCRQDVSRESITPTLPETPQGDVEGLTIYEQATLESLVKLDDYPFYFMHYVGSYEYPLLSLDGLDNSDIGCSLFTAMGEGEAMFYGRNFDWGFSPALLLVTDPPDGYASVSMVDLEFLGIQPEDSLNLTDQPLNERRFLLSAPSMPFDGMNEYGLTVGMAAVPENYTEHAPYDPTKPTLGSIGILRQALDHARDVDEAVELFQNYNIDFRGGPLIHYLLADPSGKAVLIEFYQEELLLLPNEGPWHAATNHFRCTTVGDGGCERYRMISDRLTEANGQLDSQAAMQLLEEVKQDMTQWSVVYDTTSGEIDVALGGDYSTHYSFHLGLVEK